jgi:hypothetical protein
MTPITIEEQEEIRKLFLIIFTEYDHPEFDVQYSTLYNKKYKVVLSNEIVRVDDPVKDLQWHENCRKIFLEFDIIVEHTADDKLEYQNMYCNKEDLLKMIIKDRLTS